MIFWIVVAMLLLIGLIFVIIPILRAPSDGEANDRQQQNIDIAREKKIALDKQLSSHNLTPEEHQDSLAELETALALDLEKTSTPTINQQGKWLAWFLVIALPLASIGLYLKIGEYRVIDNPSLARVAPTTEQANMTIEQMVDIVKQRLRENPDDARGWFVLGKTMMEQQQYDEAVAAFQRTLDLVGDQEAGVLFSLADALSMQQNGVMQGEPEALIQQGLKIAPRDAAGLWLAGIAAEEKGDDQAAYEYMNILLPLVTDDAESSAEINRFIARLERRNPTFRNQAKDEQQASNSPIKISVDIDPSFKQKVTPSDIVFVYAKAMDGPPMPLAVKRLTLSELPITVELSDTDAMLPSIKLSQYDMITIGARVSKSGNPVAQTGDFYTEMEAIDSRILTDEITLSIDKIKQ